MCGVSFLGYIRHQDTRFVQDVRDKAEILQVNINKEKFSMEYVSDQAVGKEYVGDLKALRAFLALDEPCSQLEAACLRLRSLEREASR